ncbi:hypothetical protein ACWERV_03115 [Streptomyces sp. NPDC004031]
MSGLFGGVRRPVRRGGRGLAVAAALAALVGLAGCGIPTTGVVEAGEPGSGVRPVVTLYFVRATDGTLTTVQRRESVPMGAEGALELLFKGPDPMEGKLLDLITLVFPPPGSVRLDRTEDGVAVDLGPDVGRLPPAAVDQIVCTAATAESVLSPDATPLPVTVTASGRPQHGTLQDLAACATATTGTPVESWRATQHP